MKLIKMISLLLCLTLIAAFAGCGKKAEPQKADDTTVSVTENTTGTQTETEPASPEETDAEGSGVSGSEWKEAYREFLSLKLEEEGPETMNEFALLYIDDDDVPELVVSEGPGAHGFGYTVLTYSNGKAIEVGYGAQIFWYYEKQGVFAFNGSGGAFSGGGEYYEMKGVNSKKLDEFWYEYGVVNYTDTPKYTINGKEVSESEYTGLEAKYSEKYGPKSDFSGYQVSRENIEKYV